MQKQEDIIRKAIKQVNSVVQKNPLAFLTESDIQCQLYTALLPLFGDIEPVSNTSIWGTAKPRTLKSISSKRLHSELLLPEGRIDLAILDLSATRFAFNSKGRFGHTQLESGNHVFIEIKVSRTHRSRIATQSRWLQLLHSDIQKLRAYPWLSFLLAYDFDFQLSQEHINEISRQAGSHTRFLYLKDDYMSNYFEQT